MAKSRREYFRKTRKTRMRELKRSRPGLAGMVCALAGVLLFLFSVVNACLQAGEAGIYVGSIGLIALVLEVGALVLGIFALREEKIRPAAPRVSLTLGVILTVLLALLYVFGF